ncbi:MAG: ferritin family protein [Candidatus Marinimicrobia bacterium]|nr:ferritin family protein [Candidatus Neomarinimicrobiota bacterium]
MKIFNVKEIIEYAIHIENESFVFYTNAAKLIEDTDIKALLVKLAGEEVDHQNRLRGLIDETKISPEFLLKEMEIDTTIMDRIVETSMIHGDASALDVLNVALEREKNTEQTYAMLMTLTQISEDVVEVFEDLRIQEQGHVNKIQARINRIA